MNNDTNNSSYFQSLQYPAELEIRVICESGFDCAHFLHQKGISPIHEETTPSKNNKFKTYKFVTVYKSYQDYINLRQLLSEHKSVQVIL